MYLKTGKNYLLYVLTIIAGGSMAHSLVPPTPGPLFVAYELGVDVDWPLYVAPWLEFPQPLRDTYGHDLLVPR